MSPKIVAEMAVSSLLNNESIIGSKTVKSMSKLPRGILKKIIAKNMSKYKF